MAPTKSTPKRPQKPQAPAPKRGRPKGATPPLPTTGFRIPPELLAEVDALAERLSTGAVRATRSTVVVDALREYVARHATPRA